MGSQVLYSCRCALYGSVAVLQMWALLVAPRVIAVGVESYSTDWLVRAFERVDFFLFLFAAIPLCILTSVAAYLAPGFLLATGLWRGLSGSHALLLAFPASFLLVVGTSSLSGLINGGVVSWPAWAAVWLATNALLVIWHSRRFRLATETIDALRAERNRLLTIAAALWLAAALLLPRLIWADFNLDGTEAFEFARSLERHWMPHWDIHDGAFGFYHNFFSFAFINSFFLNLIGPLEVSVRIPFLLHLAGIFIAIVLLVERGASRKLTGREELLIWFSLAVFSIVQVFNATYEPFYADMAEPAATDALCLFAFLGLQVCLWTRHVAAAWVFAVLTFTSSAGGLLLIGGLCLSLILAGRCVRPQLVQVLQMVCASIAATILYELVYSPRVLGGAKDQFASRHLLARLYPPQFTDLARWNALLVPSGFLPSIALLTIRRRDPIAWCSGMTAVIYFGVIYVQSWTALHQFTPVMILPLVVFWRWYLNSSRPVVRVWVRWAVAAGCLSAAVLSLPRSFEVPRAARELGRMTAFQVGDYETQYREAARASSVIGFLLPQDYRIQYPDQPWGTDPYTWLHYAFSEPKESVQPNLYVVSTGSPPPAPGAVLAAETEDVALYVRDEELWRSQRDQPRPRIIKSAVYEPILRRRSEFFREYVRRHSAEQQ